MNSNKRKYALDCRFSPFHRQAVVGHSNMVRTCCLLLLLTAWRAEAAVVSWVGGSGDWNTATNWSTGALPGPGDDVVISPANISITVTHSSGTHIVSSLMSQVAFQLTGGSVTVSNTMQVNNTFTLAGCRRS
jgi:hypothetical protein